MSDIKSFKDLLVWQKGRVLVKMIYQLTMPFPAEEKFGLTNQLRRAGVSIPSNIAEGWGRNSTGSYIQFLRIAKGSLCEAETQLILAYDLGYLKEQELKSVTDSIDELSRMLRSLIDTLDKK